MEIQLDVHLHTVSSGHAYSTLTENAAHAAAMGLQLIGTADHGPMMPGAPHFYHFGNSKIIPDTIHGVRVLKGAEVNILGTTGEVDLTDDYLAMLDFIIASLHRGVLTPTTTDDHTRASIAVMENPWVSILGHPGCGFFPIDAKAVVQAAARTHTIIEINNHTLNPKAFRFSGDIPQREIIALCVEYNVPMLLSSDAHYHTRVGDVARAMQLITESCVPPDLVLNTDTHRFMDALAKKRAKAQSS